MKSRTVPIRPTIHSRSGLTLLELLITLGLGVLLISSISAAITIYLNTETAGRARMERAQLVRAIYLKMVNDIRCVSFRESVADDSSSSTGLSAAEEASVTGMATAPLNTGPIDPDTGLTNETVGLFGDSQKLVLHISRPRRLPAAAAAGAGAGQGREDASPFPDYDPSGLRSISWSLSGTNTGNSSGQGSAGGGLSRLDQDRYLTTTEPAARGSDEGIPEGQVLAPEVTSLQFRYFDGVDWLDSWDSSTEERLPNAVEVTIAFRSLVQSQADYDIFTNGVASEVDQKPFRFVIALPLAPAPMTELQL